MSETMISGMMPVLALRGLTVFPDQTTHFEVGRKKSILALEEAMKNDQTILLIPQRDITLDDPGLEDLCTIGTVARIKQILRPQGETIRVLGNGLCRAWIRVLSLTEPFLSGVGTSVPDTEVADTMRARALRRDAAMLYAN